VPRGQTWHSLLTGLVPVIAVGLMVATPGHDRMMFSDCLNEH